MLNSNDGEKSTITVMRTDKSYFLFVVTATTNINEIAITIHANPVTYLPPSVTTSLILTGNISFDNSKTAFAYDWISTCASCAKR